MQELTRSPDPSFQAVDYSGGYTDPVSILLEPYEDVLEGGALVDPPADVSASDSEVLDGADPAGNTLTDSGADATGLLWALVLLVLLAVLTGWAGNLLKG